MIPSALRLQFYRVEVKVLPPEEAAAPRSRSVLRRFSHFQKLYSIVRPCRPSTCVLDTADHQAALRWHTTLTGHV